MGPTELGPAFLKLMEEPGWQESKATRGTSYQFFLRVPMSESDLGVYVEVWQQLDDERRWAVDLNAYQPSVPAKLVHQAHQLITRVEDAWRIDATPFKGCTMDPEL